MAVAGEERVAGVERRVHGPARRGECQGLEPGGAALGEARQEDVCGALLEAGVFSREVHQDAVVDPEPALLTDGRNHQSRRPSAGKRRHDLGEVRREHAVVGHVG